MKTYVGIHTNPDHGDLYEVVVEEPGQRSYALPRRTEVINHSPTGFCWGYNGSGPAQLALALLIDYTHSEDFAKRWYQQFKSAVIAKLNMRSGWEIPATQITEWIIQNTFKEL